jgi:UDP-N-acetylglucosamine diphosphorylase/glucosamine-1-phosphate N-acetyltransferase
MKKRAAIIMAAGKGTRMKDPSKAKVMYEILGKPMIHYVVDLAYELKTDRIIAIVGYQREDVMKYLRRTHPNVEFAVQADQLGTGHAVMQTEQTLRTFDGEVVVLSGDVPQLTTKTMSHLIDHHRATKADASILTADFEDPTGYGRIIRNADGSVNRIVEHRDASPEQLMVKEINSGIYVFDSNHLFESTKHISPHNAQNEYYLTDVFEYFGTAHLKVSATKASSVEEIQGINTLAQLEEVRKLMERALMEKR